MTLHGTFVFLASDPLHRVWMPDVDLTDRYLTGRPYPLLDVRTVPLAGYRDTRAAMQRVRGEAPDTEECIGYVVLER